MNRIYVGAFVCVIAIVLLVIWLSSGDAPEPIAAPTSLTPVTTVADAPESPQASSSSSGRRVADLLAERKQEARAEQSTSAIPELSSESGTIYGTVTVGGKPISGWAVMIESDHEDLRRFTNSKGEYRLKGLSPGQAYVGATTMRATEPDENNILFRPVLIEAGTEARVDFDLPSLDTTLTGTVTYNDQPVPHAQLFIAMGETFGHTVRRVGEASEEGIFTIPQLPPGRHWLRVSVGGSFDTADSKFTVPSLVKAVPFITISGQTTEVAVVFDDAETNLTAFVDGIRDGDEVYARLFPGEVDAQSAWERADNFAGMVFLFAEALLLEGNVEEDTVTFDGFAPGTYSLLIAAWPEGSEPGAGQGLSGMDEWNDPVLFNKWRDTIRWHAEIIEFETADSYEIDVTLPRR
jgi:hypothetical protein